MNLTRQHFTLIADIVADIDDPLERLATARRFADRLAAEAPRFDRARFLDACHLELGLDR